MAEPDSSKEKTKTCWWIFLMLTTLVSLSSLFLISGTNYINVNSNEIVIHDLDSIWTNYVLRVNGSNINLSYVGIAHFYAIINDTMTLEVNDKECLNHYSKSKGGCYVMPITSVKLYIMNKGPPGYVKINYFSGSYLFISIVFFALTLGIIYVTRNLVKDPTMPTEARVIDERNTNSEPRVESNQTKETPPMYFYPIPVHNYPQGYVYSPEYTQEYPQTNQSLNQPIEQPPPYNPYFASSRTLDV